MRSPCYECDFRNEDKNNERCQSCEKRIAYARAMQLISSETSDSIEGERMTKEVAEKLMAVQEIDTNYTKVLQDIKDIQKETPKKVKKESDHKTTLRFPAKYAHIFQDLVDIAEAEQRSVSMQTIFFIKEGVAKYKENSNER